MRLAIKFSGGNMKKSDSKLPAVGSRTDDSESIPVGKKKKIETWFLALNGAHRWDRCLFECYDRRDLPTGMFGCYMFQGELTPLAQQALNLLTSKQIDAVVAAMNGSSVPSDIIDVGLAKLLADLILTPLNDGNYDPFRIFAAALADHPEPHNRITRLMARGGIKWGDEVVLYLSGSLIEPVVLLGMGRNTGLAVKSGTVIKAVSFDEVQSMQRVPPFATLKSMLQVIERKKTTKIKSRCKRI
jgi:hypothetical protein